jgi:4-aminobutyrate aminotransferase-like enzyme
VEDVDGNKYLDFISMFAVANMGHAHPKIVAAAVEQMQNAPLVNAAWIHPFYPKLADRLCKVRQQRLFRVLSARPYRAFFFPGSYGKRTA